MEKDGLGVDGAHQRPPHEGATNLEGERPNGVSFVVSCAPTDSHKPVRDKDLCWTTLGSTAVAEGPKVEHLLVIMDANAHTGRTGEGCVDGMVLGAYGRDTLKDNGRPVLAGILSGNPTCSRQHVFSAPKRGILYTFLSPKLEGGRHRLDYILARQTDRRLARNVTAVRRPPLARPE